MAAFKVALLSLPGNKDFYDGDDYWSIATTRQCLFSEREVEAGLMVWERERTEGAAEFV